MPSTCKRKRLLEYQNLSTALQFLQDFHVFERSENFSKEWQVWSFDSARATTDNQNEGLKYVYKLQLPILAKLIITTSTNKKYC